jgi:hypothetical protein
VETFLSCVLFTEPGILIFKSTASALMEARSWPYFDPDYETIGMRISLPRYDHTGTSLKSYSCEHLCVPFECVSLFWDAAAAVHKRCAISIMTGTYDHLHQLLLLSIVSFVITLMNAKEKKKTCS